MIGARCARRCATAAGGIRRSSRSSCRSSAASTRPRSSSPGVGPVLWIVYAWLVAREVQWRRALGVAAKIGVLTLVDVAVVDRRALRSQGGYGLDILKYTETRRGGRAHVDAERDPARARLLVLLRPATGSARGSRRAPTTRSARSCIIAGYGARRARAARGRRSCGGGTARSSSLLLARRRRHRGRRASRTTSPTPLGAVFKAFADRLDRGPRAAEHRRAPCRSSCSARGAARRRRRTPCTRALRRTRGRCSALVRRRRRRRARCWSTSPRSATARSTARTCSGPRTSRSTGTDAAPYLDARRARHAGARAAGCRLRVVPVGQHRRPDHARAHGPAVRRARADPVRVGRRRPTC